MIEVEITHTHPAIMSKHVTNATIQYLYTQDRLSSPSDLTFRMCKKKKSNTVTPNLSTHSRHNHPKTHTKETVNPWI